MHVWQLLDGKPGHENQSHGLIDAFQRKLGTQKVNAHPLAAPNKMQALWQLANKRFALGKNIPPPNLIIAAGHRTHPAALAARRAYGGKLVVLMKPSIPIRYFDLCVIPEHDQATDTNNTLKTRGVLNRMQDLGNHQANRCLLLVGGKSAHAQWDDAHVVSQLKSIVRRSPDTQFVLTTSRRTPEGFLDCLQTQIQGIEIHPVEQTHGGWLTEQMNMADSAWVTADSVSMVYESLSAGLGVGIIDLPAHNKSRVMQGLATLQSQQLVIMLKDWIAAGQLPLVPPAKRFNEADWVATEILHRWPELRH